MLFNSVAFLLFFPAVCFIYFLLKKNKYRNPFLLIASYYFYMNWQPSYALLILTSTLVTYVCGVLVEKFVENKRYKKSFLVISLLINFGILFIFKYYNFINETFYALLSSLGLRWSVPNLDILLPVGISFYTFQAVGYSIDVYRGDIKAERNVVTYALFVSFFPQLVAGPIERAKNLLPQFHEEHTFNVQDVIEGFKKMVWGFFMKLCVADVLSGYVDSIYKNVHHHSEESMVLATVFFAFQIYCDFAGYSNIAIGSARILGYRLMENFKQPYLSLSVKEFWKRWHISLSTWFKDYLYIPLGGNRVTYSRHIFNLFITFLISGLWHGANWTFVVWGSLHGVYLIVENVIRKNVFTSRNESLISRLMSMVGCFILVSFAWIFFRASSIDDAFYVVKSIFTNWGRQLFIGKAAFAYGIPAVFILIFKDLKDYFGWKISFMHSRYAVVRNISVITLISYIVLFGALSSGSFIYFQF